MDWIHHGIKMRCIQCNMRSGILGVSSSEEEDDSDVEGEASGRHDNKIKSQASSEIESTNQGELEAERLPHLISPCPPMNVTAGQVLYDTSTQQVESTLVQTTNAAPQMAIINSATDTNNPRKQVAVHSSVSLLVTPSNPTCLTNLP